MKKKTLPLLLALALAGLAAATEAPAPPAGATAPDSATVAAPVAAPTAPPAATTPRAARHTSSPAAKPSKDASGEHGLKIEIKAGSDDDESAAADEASAAADDKSADNETLNSVVSIGHDSVLEAGKRAEAVVSVFGSSTSAGEVASAVVSVFGNTRVTGKVGEAAVSVFGNTYVNSRVGESVVAVLGNVELGPNAEVDEVVAIGGDLVRDPGAIVHGGVQNVNLFGHMGDMEWLHNWVHRCLMYGRPLAIAPGLGWAWTIAFSFLALYLVMALLFPVGITRCAQTMEAQPGRTALAALFTFISKPVVFVVLAITVIGAILVPFLAFGLMVAGLFGKAVAFAWLGRRALPKREEGREFPPVLAVLVGGLIAFVLYVIPVLGFIAYKGLDVLGLGMVVYTLILAQRARRDAARAALSGPGSPAAAAAGIDASMPAADELGGAAPATGAAAGGNAAGATATPATPPPTQVSLALENRAGFWIRTLALLLDFILVGVVCSIVRLRMHDSLLLMVAAYGAIMWRLRGTTIGGIVCGLRVVRLDGRAIDWPTAITRALASFLSLFVAGLGFIWVVFDAERQSWHDKIAGTVIVHAPRGTPLV